MCLGLPPFLTASSSAPSIPEWLEVGSWKAAVGAVTLGIWPRAARVVPLSHTADEGASWDLAYDSQDGCFGQSDKGHGRSCVLRLQAWIPSSLQPASQFLIQLAPCGSDNCSSGALGAGRRTLHDVAGTHTPRLPMLRPWFLHPQPDP